MGLIFKSIEQQARDYVKYQLKLEGGNYKLLGQGAGENYLARLQAGATVDELVQERIAQMKLAREAARQVKRR